MSYTAKLDFKLNSKLQDSEFKDNMFKSILAIAFSIVVLLAFMFVFKTFSSGFINTLVNLVSMVMAIIVLLRLTKLEKLLGDRIVLLSCIFSVSIVVFSLVFSSLFVYDGVLSGDTPTILHQEHRLMYNELRIIATRLLGGKTLEQATDGLPLNQYYNIFVYSSSMFYFGGVNVTNMCIWSMMHSIINAVCMALMSYEYGIKDKSRLLLIYFLTIFQPLMLNIQTYNKVIIGQTFVVLAMYIYVKTYRRPLYNILCFPAYAWLLWSMRQQYLVIAAILCVLMFFINKNKLTFETTLEFSIIIVVFLILFLVTDVRGYISEDLNFDSYTEGGNYSIFAIPMRILRSFISYFPFTHIFNDIHWTFNIYCIGQVCANILLWGYVLIDSLTKKRFKQIFTNPMILAAIGLLFAGLISSLHTTYVSVGSIFLLTEVEDKSIKKVVMNFVVVFAIMCLASVVYRLLGLTGSNISGLA